MKICIYCAKGEDSTSFGSREHVIPQLLGSFDNSPTLIGWVCNDCNSSVFCKLENRFKEDTEEGVFCQMLNFSESSEIRVRNGNAKLTFDLGLDDPFFNKAFPFLTRRNGEWKMLFQPQILVRGYGEDGFIVLLFDKVKILPRNSKKFRKIKNLLKNAQSKDVSIFVHGAEDPERKALNEAMDLVRELGIPYKPGEEKSTPLVGDGSDKKTAHVEMETTIGFDTARVLAKVAFNYFAYCAIQSGEQDVLYHENFSRIKSYILGVVELPINQVLIEKPSYNPILFEEQDHGTRLVGHTIAMSIENGNIVVRISFIGRLVNKILLGRVPVSINRPEFGNGHAFEPFHHKIFGLTQNPARQGSHEALSFSLFNNH